MAVEADLEYMRRALRLAAKARGYTSPNPMVGAVLVRDGQIVGQGYHRAAGLDHAEIAAIKQAGDKARGATLYVTLEPCCHTGRTGPCTEAILRASIKKVYYSIDDPDHRVNCRGGRCLTEAGFEVQKGLLKEEARQLNESYFGFHHNRRPWVILKTAQTLDGRIATKTGDSKWISSPPSLKLAHRLRSEVDAVVVGAGTVRTDNPALTVRLVKGKNPYRIVLTGSARLPQRCRLLSNNDDCRTIVATTAAEAPSLAARHARSKLITWSIKSRRDGNLDLIDFLQKAKAFGIQSLLVEGGAHLATAFLKSGLVDKCIVVLAPMVLGEGISAVGDLAVNRLAGAIKFDRFRFSRCGPDMVFVGYPMPRSV